ncbi:MAG TPA: NAD(P)H-dependent oxidoreductase [Actinocrinis sp.]|nr:NAD(P)H-dependent oxidoreductase [Actinocrinis sp.]
MRTLLLISGSLRKGSSNEAVLRTAAALLPPDVTATFYEGLSDLPHFNPDDDQDPLPEPVADLRARIAAADALLICTPEYAGALPGSFLNLLDWTVGGVEISDKPTAWINASARETPDGARLAHESLRIVLTYTGAAIVDEACVRIPMTRALTGPDGTAADQDTRARIAEAVAALLA